MRNRDTGVRRNSVLKNCTIVAFVLALALTVCGIGAVWVFATHDKRDWQLNHVELAPALAYFDSNRDLLPIQDIDIVDVATKCPSALEGWEEVESLAQWRGTNLGCFHDSTVSLNSCSKDNQNGNPINAREAVNLAVWATDSVATPGTNLGKKFCVQRIKSQQFVAENSVGQCATGESQCGCKCVSLNPGVVAPDCPISGFQFTTTNTAPPAANGLTWTTQGSYTDGVNIPTGNTGTSQEYFMWMTRTVKDQYQIPSMGNLAVEFYDSACTNPNNHPKDPAGQYKLMSSGFSGCGLLGTDTSTQIVGTMNEWDFYVANNDVNDGLATEWSAQLDTDLPTYKAALENKSEFFVNLLNRQIITTACTAECDDFRFGTESKTILSLYGQIWNQIRLLGVVSMSCAVVALCMLTLIYIEGVRRQTQNYMTVLYAFCIVGLFLAVIYLWKAQDILSRKYNIAHRHYKNAVNNKCLDGKWGKVLSLWYRHTSFQSLDSQLWYTLAICLLLLVVGVVFAIIALMQLARKKTIPGNYHTDNQI